MQTAIDLIQSAAIVLLGVGGLMLTSFVRKHLGGLRRW